MYNDQQQFAERLNRYSAALTGYGWHVNRTLPHGLADEAAASRAYRRADWLRLPDVVAGLRGYFRRQAARRELHALNDRVLRDIGLPRHMIDTVVAELFEREGDTDRQVHSVASALRQVARRPLSANDEEVQLVGCG